MTASMLSSLGLAAALLPLLPAQDPVRTGSLTPNRGQWPAAARFQMTGSGGAVWATDSGLRLTLETASEATTGLEDAPGSRVAGRGPGAPARQRGASQSVWIEFGTGRPPRAEQHTQRSACSSFFLGDCTTTAVPGFDAIRYTEAWPGIDVVVRAAGTDTLGAYDLHLASPAQCAAIQFTVKGAERLESTASGDLQIRTPSGTLTQTAPVAWQRNALGRRHDVRCRFTVDTKRQQFGFALDGCLPGRPVVIDPTLRWVTLLGGNSGAESGMDVERADDGTLFVTGYTASTNFPVTTGAVPSGSQDIFVARLDPSLPVSGQLIWSTLIGGFSDDVPFDLDIDRNGNLALTGYTRSSNFPTTAGAVQPAWGGGLDAFVLRLASNGTSLLASTFVGGVDNDFGCAIELDASDRPILAAYSYSTGLPTARAEQPTHRGMSELYLARYAPNLSAMDWGTYLGSTGWEGFLWNNFAGFPSNLRVLDLELSDTGRLAVTGITGLGNFGSIQFPTTANAVQRTGNSSWDVFACLIEPDAAPGSQVHYSTLLGSVSGEEGGMNVDVLPGDRLVVSGYTYSAGTMPSNTFPTTPGAPQRMLAGQNDAFLAQIDPARSGNAGLVYSTLAGGTGVESPHEMSVDPREVVTWVGFSNANFPTTPGARSQVNAGQFDAFVGRIRMDGQGSADWIYSSLVGGDGFDHAHGLATEGTGAIALTGNAGRSFPGTPGASDDVFVTISEMLPSPVQRHAGSSPSCRGPVLLEVGQQPQPNRPLEFLIGGAPAGAPGVLLFSGTPNGFCLPLLGAEVCLPLPAWFGTQLVADAAGSAQFTMVLPPTIPAPPATVGLGVQAVFVNTAGCPRALSSTAALSM